MIWINDDNAPFARIVEETPPCSKPTPSLGQSRQRYVTRQRISVANDMDVAEEWISDAQAKAGDFAGAQLTAERIEFSNYRDNAETAIGAHWASSGSGHMPVKLAPLVPASDWVIEIGWLDAPIFLDRAAFLRALPTDSADSTFKALSDATRTILDAQNDVERLLTLQAADQTGK